MKKLAIYNHGKDSAPWGGKPQAFADVARQQGYVVESPDYRSQMDPDARVSQLLAMDWSGYDKIVLIGSSMGAYVATLAAETLQADGLFLLAPAFYLPSYGRSEFSPPADRTRVYHGWQDDVVPPENAWRFCQQYRVRLQMLDSDHRLISEIPYLQQELSRFLSELN